MQANTEDDFILVKRRSLIVWVRNFKQLKVLKRFGFIHYVSSKMKYVVLYMNEEDIDVAMNKISSYNFVNKVEKSYRPDIEMNFSEKIGSKKAYQVAEEDLFSEE